MATTLELGSTGFLRCIVLLFSAPPRLWRERGLLFLHSSLPCLHELCERMVVVNWQRIWGITNRLRFRQGWGRERRGLPACPSDADRYPTFCVDIS